MKKILLGILFLISFSFSCDSPYEEIQGVKMGCEFIGGDDFVKGEEESLGEHYYIRTKNIKFFDQMEVETDADNRVIGVSFLKRYPVTMSNMKLQEERIIEDYKQFIKGLSERWGDFDTNKAKRIFSRFTSSGVLFLQDLMEVSINTHPKSDVVGAIIVTLSYDMGMESMMFGNAQEADLSLIYMGKEVADKLKREQESVTDGF